MEEGKAEAESESPPPGSVSGGAAQQGLQPGVLSLNPPSPEALLRSLGNLPFWLLRITWKSLLFLILGKEDEEGISHGGPVPMETRMEGPTWGTRTPAVWRVQAPWERLCWIRREVDESCANPARLPADTGGGEDGSGP